MRKAAPKNKPGKAASGVQAAPPVQKSTETESEHAIRCLKLTRAYKNIRMDLLDQLERNCTTGRYYTDLVEDYMAMWMAKSLAIQDVRERGIVVFYDNGGGQCGKKKNDSVELQMKLNAQMLRLLSEMGIRPSQGDGEEDEL